MRGGWWCCCKTVIDCFIAEDTFTESGTEPVAPTGWTEVYGDWLVDPVTDVLYTETTDGFLQYDTIHPDNNAANYVEVDVTFDTRLDKAQVVFAEDYDTDNLVFELEWSPTCADIADQGVIPDNEIPNFPYFGAATMRIYRNADLIASAFQVPIYDSTVRIKAGYTIADKVAWMEVETLGWEAHYTWTRPITCIKADPLSVAITARYVGLGTGDVVEGTIIFDNFTWYRSYTAAIPNCPGPCDPLDPISTCIIDPRFCVPTKDPLVSSDIYLDWTIVDGTWKGERYNIDIDSYASCLKTLSSNALVESNTEQTGVSTFGYMWQEGYASGREGDVLRFYMDYESTASCHLAEFVLGDATGDGGSISLYKNGTLLTTELYPVPSGADILIKICLRPDTDSDYDVFWAEVNNKSKTHTPYDGVLTATTVNGNKRRALGTGTISDEVIFYPTTLLHAITLDDGRLCPCYSWVECEHCPSGDGVEAGISFSISGWQTPYGGTCDCPTELDGTYNITKHILGSHSLRGGECINLWPPSFSDPYPYWLSEGGYHYFWWWDTSCTYQYLLFNPVTTVALGLRWKITAGTGNDWILQLEISIFYKWVYPIMGSTPLPIGTTYFYKATFDNTTLCTSLVDAPLTYDFMTGDDEWVCSGTGLTVTATSY